MSELRLIDDQTRTGAAGRIQLNQNGFLIDNFAVKELVLQLTYNGTNGDGLNAESLYDGALTWAYNQRVTVELSNGSRLIDNVPIGLVDVAQSFNYKTDTAAPTLAIAPEYAAGATADNQSVFLRIPVAWTQAQRSRDFWRSLSSFGAVYYDFNNTGVNSDITVNSVRAQLYAVGCTVNDVMVPPPLKVRYFAPTSDLVDRLNIGGERILYLGAVTTDATNEPITEIIQPQVQFDGRMVLDARQTIESSDVQALQGEQRYAATNFPPFGVTGAGTARTRFQTWYAAPDDFKISELPPVKAVQLEYSAQGIPTEELYYVAVTACTLRAGDAAALIPSLRGEDNAQIQQRASRKIANAGGMVSPALKAALPVTFKR